MEYQKINTLFMRDEKNIIIPDKFCKEEFEYLKDCPFECTEKIDGTNMRIEIEFDEKEVRWTYKGRTDKADIPSHLLAKMQSLFDDVDWREIFPKAEPGTKITIYGEGYGLKIQKGGNYISNDCRFILFDVRVGNWWLNRAACEEIANKLNVPIVPIIGYMTIQQAIDYVRAGFKSTIAENKDYDAEGLVLKTPTGLLFRNGERIVLKIKTCDFKKYEAVHK